MKNITLEEIIEYKKGNKSAKLNMAMAYDMPYIAEKEMINGSIEEKILMAGEVLSTYNGDNLFQFLQQIIRYEMVDGLINNVSLLTLAKTVENDLAYEYLKQYEIQERGLSLEALEVITTFNAKEKVTKDDMLNFLLGEVKKIRKCGDILR